MQYATQSVCLMIFLPMIDVDKQIADRLDIQI